MRGAIPRILLTILFLLAVLGALVTPTEALAVIQNLNGATQQTQSFLNDPNVTISTNPATGVHSFGWQGLLPVSRGGTGAGSFINGSIPFIFNGVFSEDNPNFYWDNINKRLGIGTASPTTTLDVLGNAKISGNLNVTGNITSINLVPYTGATGDLDLGVFGLHTTLVRSNDHIISPTDISIEAGSVTGTNGNAASIALISGAASTGTGVGGSIFLRGGPGGDTSGRGGNINISGGDAIGENSDGGIISFKPGFAWRSGTVGHVKFSDPMTSNQAAFDTSLLTTIEKTFTFPDASGTFGLLEANQTWNGLNKFEASSNSTIYVGSSVKSGCIALGDSDGTGITYVTANDGVLTASSTKPSVCQ